MRELRLKQNDRTAKGEVAPSVEEKKLADRLTQNMRFLTKYSQPGNLVEAEDIKRAVRSGEPVEEIGSLGKGLRMENADADQLNEKRR